MRASTVLSLICVFVLWYPAGTRAATEPKDHAIRACSGAMQPTGSEQQFSPCKGMLPIDLLGSATSFLLSTQKAIPGHVQAKAAEIMNAGQEAQMTERFSTHTYFDQEGGLPCSFESPGENRFVADKFGFNGLADFQMPFPTTYIWMPINRYVGDVSETPDDGDVETDSGNLADFTKLVNSGLIGEYATLKVAAYGCCNPTYSNQAFDGKFMINGHTAYFLDSGVQLSPMVPTILEAKIPIQWLRFPGIASNQRCPWPALNHINVFLPFKNVMVDWVEIEIETTPPWVLVPGDQTTNAGVLGNALSCKVFKDAKYLAGQVPYGGLAFEFVGTLLPLDLCARGSLLTWEKMMRAIYEDGTTAKPVDDMVQVPSDKHGDGWWMCLNDDGDSVAPFSKISPLEMYLVGAAKSMGVGTVNVMAHSKGGVDSLVYLANSDFYKNAYDDKKLNVRNVVSISSPFQGSPLASNWINNLWGGGAPLPGFYDPLAEKGVPFLSKLAVLVPIWRSIIKAGDYYFSPSRLLSGPFDQATDLACLGASIVGEFQVNSQMTPEQAYRIRNMALAKGMHPSVEKWLSIGANADSSGDDRINESCGSGSTVLLGGYKIANCVPQDDDLLDNEGALTDDRYWSPNAYLIVGAGRCKSWNEIAGSCGEWSKFSHNDAAVDVFSAELPPVSGTQVEHWNLDMFAGHAGHSNGGSVDTNADHGMAIRSRAPQVWAGVRQSIPRVLRTNYLD